MTQSFALMHNVEGFGPAAAAASDRSVVRMRVVLCQHHRGDERGQEGAPAVEPVTEVRAMRCPAGYRFGGRDYASTRISGYSDGWNFSGRVTNVFVPHDEVSGELRMTLTIDELTWVGPTSVAHPILGVFEVAYSEDVTLRCQPSGLA